MEIAKLRFVITPEQELWLPPYKGAVLRGGFGQALQRLCHPRRGEGCRQREKCLYCYVFDTQAARQGTQRNIPRPYVIEPPLDTSAPSLDGPMHYRQGEELTFHLLLFGRVIDYWPTLFLAFKKLGALGLGQGRGRFRIRRVESVRGHETKEVYDEDTGALAAGLLRLTPADFFRPVEQSVSLLELQLLTPIQLTQENRAVSTKTDLAFHIVVRRLLGRLSDLAYHHGDEPWAWDYEGLIEQATRVQVDETSTRVAYRTVDVHSARQDPTHSREDTYQITGFVGTLVYEGEGLEAFLPYLRLGEYTHIGKKTVQGAGWYRLRKPATDWQC